MYGYRRRMKVLTVGDGDFTFSLVLAECMLSSDDDSMDDDDAGVIIFTSYETRSTLNAV